VLRARVRRKVVAAWGPFQPVHVLAASTHLLV